MIRTGSLLALHCDVTDVDTHGSAPFAVPSFGLGDAKMLVVHLAPMARADIWRNGRSLGAIAGAVGSLQVFDLRQTWRAEIHPPFNSLNMRLPQALLEAVAEEAGIDPSRLALPAPEDGVVDPVMLGLAQALVPSFNRPSEVTTLFADRVLGAVAAHLVDVYRGRGGARRGFKEGLAPWQQRRVVDLLMDNLDKDISITALAETCALSSAHFSKAFRLSFGLPPHRWLLRERVRRASELMASGDRPLNEVAIAVGFYDQSHLTRVFARFMGVTPAAWRRMQAR